MTATESFVLNRLRTKCLSRKGARAASESAAPSKDERVNRGIPAARPCLALRARGRFAGLP